MSNLFIDNKGMQVPVAGLELISAKQQVVLGNTERDLVLRTLGGIKIQIGNKFYNLPIVIDESTNSLTIAGTSNIVIDNSLELLSLVYPGDGTLIYSRQNKTIYIADKGGYQLINKSSTNEDSDTIYLSFLETQELTGEQKQTVLLNTGYIVNQLSDASSITQVETYENQLIFSLEEGKHYKLIDRVSPELTASWQELYISTSGGKITGNLLIDGSLTVLGENKLQVGALEVYNNTQGDILFSSLTDNKYTGFKFLTHGSTTEPYTALTLLGKSVSIGGFTDFKFGLTVNPTTIFKSDTHFQTNLFSTDFSEGINGSGFAITKDNLGKWMLEIDNLKVRSLYTSSEDRYIATGIEGSEILSYDLNLSDTIFMEEIPIYIKATLAGRFKDTAGTLVQFSERGTKAYAIRTPIIGVHDEDTVEVYEPITLAFGIGDYNDALSPITGTTYAQYSTGYNLIPATHSYNGAAFIENALGNLVLVDVIKLYSCRISANLQIGDLLYSKEWDANKNTMYILPVEVVAIVDGITYLYVYNQQGLTDETKLIKIGNNVTGSTMLQLNSSDESSATIEFASNVRSLNDLIDSFSYEDENIISPTSKSIINTNKVRFKVGNLSNILNSEIGLNNTNTEGLYSDNAYLKGRFVGDYLKLGDKLSYENSTLSLSTTNVQEGSNLYYTDVRVKTYGDTLYAPIIHTHAFTNLTSIPTTLIGYGITDAVPNIRTITINGQTADLSVNRSWTIPPPILNWSDITNKPSIDLEYVLTRGNLANNYISLLNNIYLTKAASDDIFTGTRIQLNSDVNATRSITMQLGNDGDLLLSTYKIESNFWDTRLRISNATGDVRLSKTLSFAQLPTQSISTYEVLTVNTSSGVIEKVPTTSLPGRTVQVFTSPPVGTFGVNYFAGDIVIS